MPPADYDRVMAKLSDQYGMLREGSALGTQYAQNLMLNLNPTVNPTGSRKLISGLENIIGER